MMSKPLFALVGVVLGVVLLAESANAAGDAAAGASQFAVCVACHGAKGEGNKAMNAPRIAGQEDWYVKRQIELFKAGARGGPGDTYGAQMRPMAMTLATPAAVDNVIAYLATLEPGAPVETTVDGDPAAGQARYAVCAACHGPKGEGNKALNAPKLVGIQDWYVVRQLQNYAAGVRGKHPQDTFGKQMIPMAMTLPDDQARKDVAAYLNSLQ